MSKTLRYAAVAVFCLLVFRMCTSCMEKTGDAPAQEGAAAERAPTDQEMEGSESAAARPWGSPPVYGGGSEASVLAAGRYAGTPIG